MCLNHPQIIPQPSPLGFPGAQLVKNLPAMLETWVRSVGWEDPWIKERIPTPIFWPGESHGLYIHGVLKSRSRLNNFHFHPSSLKNVFHETMPGAEKLGDQLT